MREGRAMTIAGARDSSGAFPLSHCVRIFQKDPMLIVSVCEEFGFPLAGGSL